MRREKTREKPRFASHMTLNDEPLIWLESHVSFVYNLEENSEQFTNAKRNPRVFVWRRNSSRCRIERKGKMSNEKSRWWTACSILKSSSFMMRSSTTKWCAWSWNCKYDELHSCPIKLYRINFSSASMAVNYLIEFWTTSSFWRRKLARFSCDRFAKPWNTFTNITSSIST